MNKYLLLVYGNFQNTQTTSDVVDIVANVTSTPLLRFKEENSNVLFHFGSSSKLEYLIDYFEKKLKKYSNTYILSEMTDKTTVVMPDADMGQFMTLSTDNEDINKYQNNKTNEHQTNELEYILQTLLGGTIFDDKSYDDYFEYDDEDDDDFLIKKPSKAKKNNGHNLDEILDKIKINGRQSLTKEEENFLKTI